MPSNVQGRSLAPLLDGGLTKTPEFAQVRQELARKLYQHMVETEDPLLKGAVTSPHHVKTLKLLEDAGR